MSEPVPVAVIAANARDTVCPNLPFPSYISPPIPDLKGSTKRVCFLIGRGEVLDSDSGYWIWPPRLLAAFRCDNGRLAELRAVTPGEFGQDADPESPLAQGLSPLEKADPAYLEKQLRLFEVCEDVLASSSDATAPTDALESLAPRMADTADAALAPYLLAMLP